MDILSRISQKEVWESFYIYKSQAGHLSKAEEGDLRSFIDNLEFQPFLEKIKNGEPFSPPKKVLLNKAKNSKKRIVYTYKREENYILKLISFLLREYDGVFAPNLYSFRNNRGVKRATEDILKIKGLNDRFVYKADIHDYFNSADIGRLLPILERILQNDKQLFEFLRSLLEFPFAEYEGELICEQRGMMAGVPISAFLANLYLSELDFHFYNSGIPYMRYSDDILVFGKSEEEIFEHREFIRNFIEKAGLTLNPKKESISRPNEEWTFLGFSYNKGVIDVSAVSAEKLKSKMRRKTRSLQRWTDRKGVERERAVKAFIRKLNEKLFDNPIDSELTWTRWFFPIINTDKTLHEIDTYMQDCIRFLATGKRNKKRFDFTYEDMKKLGYINLVNEYHKKKTSEN